MGGHPGQMGGQPQVTLMLVNVPHNVRSGENMVVMTPSGQQYMVVVPPGAGPGSQFQIAVPRNDNPMAGGYGGYPGMQQPGMGQPGMNMAMGGRGYGMQPPGMMMDGRGRGAMGGRGRGRKRKDKDVNRAPRQPSQYNLFMKTEVARIKQTQPELTHKEAFKEAARNWGVSDQNPAKRQASGLGIDAAAKDGAEGAEVKTGEGEEGAAAGEEGADDAVGEDGGEEGEAAAAISDPAAAAGDMAEGVAAPEPEVKADDAADLLTTEAPDASAVEPAAPPSELDAAAPVDAVDAGLDPSDGGGLGGDVGGDVGFDGLGGGAVDGPAADF